MRNYLRFFLVIFALMLILNPMFVRAEEGEDGADQGTTVSDDSGQSAGGEPAVTEETSDNSPGGTDEVLVSEEKKTDDSDFSPSDGSEVTGKTDDQQSGDGETKTEDEKPPEKTLAIEDEAEKIAEAVKSVSPTLEEIYGANSPSQRMEMVAKRLNALAEKGLFGKEFSLNPEEALGKVKQANEGYEIHGFPLSKFDWDRLRGYFKAEGASSDEELYAQASSLDTAAGRISHKTDSISEVKGYPKEYSVENQVSVLDGAFFRAIDGNVIYDDRSKSGASLLAPHTAGSDATEVAQRPTPETQGAKKTPAKTKKRDQTASGQKGTDATQTEKKDDKATPAAEKPKKKFVPEDDRPPLEGSSDDIIVWYEKKYPGDPSRCWDESYMARMKYSGTNIALRDAEHYFYSKMEVQNAGSVPMKTFKVAQMTIATLGYTPYKIIRGVFTPNATAPSVQEITYGLKGVWDGMNPGTKAPAKKN